MGPVSPEKRTENIEKQEAPKILPNFLCEKNGRLFTAVKGDTDVNDEYEEFLKKIGKKSDFPPGFLYDTMDGRLHMGEETVVDVTEVWEEWLKTLKLIE